MLPYPAVSCRILPYPAVSCRILPYPVVSCRILPYLPYTAVSCFPCRILPYANNPNPSPNANPNPKPNPNPNLEFQLLLALLDPIGGGLINRRSLGGLGTFCDPTLYEPLQDDLFSCHMM